MKTLNQLKNKYLYLFFISILSIILIGCGSGGGSSGGGTTTQQPQPIPQPPQPTPTQLTVSLQSNNGSVIDKESNTSTTPNIIFNFNYTVESSKINNSNIIIYPTGMPANPVTISNFTANNNNTIFSLQTPLLAQNTQYTVAVLLTKIESYNASDAYFSFTTGMYPVTNVSLVSLNNNAQNTSVVPNVQVHFSQSVQNVTNNNIHLHQNSESGIIVPLSNIKSNGNNNYTLVLESELAGLTTYYITIESGIMDTYGNIKRQIFNFTTRSLQYKTLGIPGFSSGTARSASIAISPVTQRPYVIYSDEANGYKATVMMFNGTSWVNVGTPGFTATPTYLNLIAIDNNNNIYISYQPNNYGSNAIVMKYNGTSWSYLGNPNGIESATVVNFVTLVLDKQGTPYIAARLYNSSKYYLSVMKYDGANWQPMISINQFSGNYPSLIFDNNNNLYMGYMDLINPSISVVKFNGSSWSYLGVPGFINTNLVEIPQLSMDGNSNLYIAYRNASNGSSIQNFVGESWNSSIPQTSLGAFAWTNTRFDNANTLYQTYIRRTQYTGGIQYGTLDTIKFNGAGWEPMAFGANIYDSDDVGNYFAIDKNNVPYIVFPDSDNGNRITVATYIP